MYRNVLDHSNDETSVEPLTDIHLQNVSRNGAYTTMKNLHLAFEEKYQVPLQHILNSTKHSLSHCYSSEQAIIKSLQTGITYGTDG